MYRSSISSRLDLEMNQDSEDTDGEKDGRQIVDEQAGRHGGGFFGCFVC